MGFFSAETQAGLDYWDKTCWNLFSLTGFSNLGTDRLSAVLPVNQNPGVKILVN